MFKIAELNNGEFAILDNDNRAITRKNFVTREEAQKWVKDQAEKARVQAENEDAAVVEDATPLASTRTAAKPARAKKGGK